MELGDPEEPRRLLEEVERETQAAVEQGIRRLVTWIDVDALDVNQLRDLVRTISRLLHLQDTMQELMQQYADGPDTMAAAVQVVAEMQHEVARAFAEVFPDGALGDPVADDTWEGGDDE
jgi:hypothetical protein